MDTVRWELGDAEQLHATVRGALGAAARPRDRARVLLPDSRPAPGVGRRPLEPAGLVPGTHAGALVRGRDSDATGRAGGGPAWRSGPRDGPRSGPCCGGPG